MSLSRFYDVVFILLKSVNFLRWISYYCRLFVTFAKFKSDILLSKSKAILDLHPILLACLDYVPEELMLALVFLSVCVQVHVSKMF